VSICVLITEAGADKMMIKILNDKDAVVRRSAPDNFISRPDNDDNGDEADDDDNISRYPAAVSVSERDNVYRRSGYHRDQCVCMSVCHCDVCRQSYNSFNTSLYPMIGSCTTSSCHVDSVPRPHLTNCSTCCVYEYAMDSFQTGLSLDSVTTETGMDCSAMKGTSVSWSTVHSAPAVLDRLTRYKLPASQGSVYNCTTIRQAHDRHERHATYRRDRRDEFCCYHSPFYYANPSRYQPLAYTYTSAAVADAGDYYYDDGDYDERYDQVAGSLRIAKPVLAETQYWV